MKTLVTNAEIEEVGESLIRRFIGKRKPPPNCIDIEGFITDYLHLPVVYLETICRCLFTALLPISNNLLSTPIPFSKA